MPKTVLITGASSGIGEALALYYASKNFDLYLLARRASHLEKVKNRCRESNKQINVITIQSDVTDIENLKSEITTKIGSNKLDIVIANAGVGIAGNFDKLKLEHYRNNSYLSLPGKSPYCMSKSAVKALADSLYYEFKSQNINVTLICPGLVESEIRLKDNEGSLRSDFKDPAPSSITMSSEKAAGLIYKAIKKNKKEVTITLHGKVLVWLERHFPLLLQPLKKGFMGKI
jgi:short-subunit dehydrogenase